MPQSSPGGVGPSGPPAGPNQPCPPGDGANPVAGGQAQPAPQAAPQAAAPKREPCGFTSRRLLRTVVSAWRRVDTTTGFVPRPGHVPGGAAIVSVTWERDIINVFGVFVCSLEKGHKGPHHGAQTEERVVTGTVRETVIYGRGERQVPPQNHYTDALPQE